MNRTINKVAVIGAGTMGAGIAGLCAATGLPVTLLDLNTEAATAAVERLSGGKNPVIDASQAALITCGSIDDDLGKVSDADWICEVIIEDLAAKRALFGNLEKIRKDGSIITSNTSGIPLRDICQGMPERFNRDVAVTHFFNPVHIMRLLELVPGSETDPDVISGLATFCRDKLGKGVVYAKDTVNFIGNRIGCFWVLAGLHKGIAAQQASDALSMETIDALLSKPFGLPPTGLYGLVDLIGLDIMDHVAKNLRQNLPEGDEGFRYIDFPAAEVKMINDGQLGRKTGGGYYKLLRGDDGSKTMTIFDLNKGTWRNAEPVTLDQTFTDYRSLLMDDSPEGRFTWDLMSETLCYAAVVNVDRAMRWGFNWAQGPFELLDGIGCQAFIDRLENEGRTIPNMLVKLQNSGNTSFYQNDNYLGVDGEYTAIPSE